MFGSINLFGSMLVYDANLTAVAMPSGRARELLAALALEAGSAINRDELASRIWGSENGEAKKALNTTLWRLRKTLKDHPGCTDWLKVDGDTIYLQDAEGPTLDTNSLSEMAYRPEALLNEDADLPQLVESYEPLLLSDLSSDWLEEYRREYRDIYVQLLGDIAGLLEDVDDPRHAMMVANRLVKVDQFDERGWRLMMRTHISRGNRSRATKCYHELCEMLEDELDVGPSPQTISLAEEQLKPPPLMTANFHLEQDTETRELTKRILMARKKIKQVDTELVEIGQILSDQQI